MKNWIGATALLALMTAQAHGETVLKLGHFASGTDPFSQSVEAFAEQVKRATDGEVTIQIYPGGQLGNEKQQISALQGGLQDILITASTNISAMQPELKLLDLPFAFPDYASADAVTMGPVGEEMMSGLEDNGLIGMALWENGFRVISNSKHPVETMDDLKGLNIRVIGAPIFIDTFNALGANPVPMPFPELFSALETGTVDGQDNPAFAMDALKFYEVQKYYTPTNHMYGALIVLGSEASLSRLSDEDRNAVLQAAKDFGTRQREILRDANTAALEHMREEGLKVIDQLSPETFEAFKAATSDVTEAQLTDELKPLYAKMQDAVASAEASN